MGRVWRGVCVRVYCVCVVWCCCWILFVSRSVPFAARSINRGNGTRQTTQHNRTEKTGRRTKRGQNEKEQQRNTVCDLCCCPCMSVVSSVCVLLLLVCCCVVCVDCVPFAFASFCSFVAVGVVSCSLLLVFVFPAPIVLFESKATPVRKKDDNQHGRGDTGMGDTTKKEHNETHAETNETTIQEGTEEETHTNQ